MKKKKVLIKNPVGPLIIFLIILMLIEFLMVLPKNNELFWIASVFIIFSIVVFFICLFFSGIQISEDGILIGTGTKCSVLKYEKKGKMKNWYSFPFKDLVYVNCVRRLDAQTFNFSLIIIKKNGVKYEIEFVGNQYVKLKKTLKLYFENYKKKHPEQFTNINLSEMTFGTLFLHIWF